MPASWRATGSGSKSTPWRQSTGPRWWTSSRLILAASAVGTGKALPLPASATVFDLNSAELVAQLFPKNQAAAARDYLNAIQQYPGFYQVSAATFHSQYLAAERWLAGQDAAGHLVGDLRVPTLVADGTLDQDTGPPTPGS